MSDLYYCKIYIDTEASIEEIETVLADVVADTLEGISVEYPVYRNENFYPAARKNVPYEFVECSRYYVEMGVEENTPEGLSIFHSAVVAVIRRLREAGCFATASCDFEDVVAEATGWNWTEGNPEPPNRDVAALADRSI